MKANLLIWSVRVRPPSYGIWPLWLMLCGWALVMAGALDAGWTQVLSAAAEGEPNDSPRTATPLDLSSGFALMSTNRGGTPLAISPSGDTDWYSFTAPPQARVWALVDTGGSQNPGANSRDSVLTLFAGDGLTVIENDDDDGSGNGCDSTLESGDASAIAGRMLGAGGTYYLRVSAYSENQIIDPYRLFVALTPLAPVSEVEPNDEPGRANPLLTAASPIAQRLGRIAVPGDVDLYSIVAPSNCLLYVSADCDPYRDGPSRDLVLDLLSTDGTTPLFSADSSGRTNNAAEAFCFFLATPGTYFVRVKPWTGTGTYNLMATRSPAESEPNDSPAAAVPIFALDQFVHTLGTITPGGDADYYSFVAPPGARLWATVDTGGPQDPGATSRDSVLTLLAPDGATVIEEDDNDGSGNGGDTSLESSDASAIAGRALITGGNCFLRARSADGGVINPYRLYVILTTASPVPETEPNDSASAASRLLAEGPTIGLRSGTLATSGDADFYSLVVWAGNMLHLSADGDPERDGLGTDLTLDLLAPDGTTLLFSANSSAIGSSGNPPAEGFAFIAPVSGTYFVRVRPSGASAGTYHLMAARNDSQLRMTALAFTGVDTRIRFTSLPGRSYQVERSDHLAVPTSWVPLGTVSGNGTVVQYLDMGGAGHVQRYYRLRQVP